MYVFHEKDLSVMWRTSKAYSERYIRTWPWLIQAKSQDYIIIKSRSYNRWHMLEQALTGDCIMHSKLI